MPHWAPIVRTFGTITQPSDALSQGISAGTVRDTSVISRPKVLLVTPFECEFALIAPDNSYVIPGIVSSRIVNAEVGVFVRKHLGGYHPRSGLQQTDHSCLFIVFRDVLKCSGYL